MRSRARKRVGKRRRLGQVLTELHYQLRTEGDRPIPRAVAVGLGTFVGCLPIYGLHLAVCAIFARLLRVSRILTYLAAHINNPLTAAPLIYIEYLTGHRILNGKWPDLVPSIGSLSFLDLSLTLLLGGAVVGAALGIPLGLVSYFVSMRWTMPPLRKRLLERTSQRYLESGIFTWEFVRSKLRHDPIYTTLPATGLFSRDGHLVDLGCGRGILLALLRTAREVHREGMWDESASSPPGALTFTGVEVNPKHAEAAVSAMGDDARIIVASLTDYEPEPCDIAVLFDVLHYMPADEQEKLLRSICRALRPGGTLLIRDADTLPRWRFRLTQLAEVLAGWARRNWGQRFHYRGAAEWQRLLESAGMNASVRPMQEGTPFSNFLIEAEKPRASSVLESRP